MDIIVISQNLIKVISKKSLYLNGFSQTAFVKVNMCSANSSGPEQSLTEHPVASCRDTMAAWHSSHVTSERPGAAVAVTLSAAVAPASTCLRKFLFSFVLLPLKHRDTVTKRFTINSMFLRYNYKHIPEIFIHSFSS